MNVERLNHLIAVLQQVPPEHLDLTFWRRGATACALGWACRDPEFQAQGLDVWPGTGSPCFGSDVGFDAAEAFFDLDVETVKHLFASTRYAALFVTPQHVIDRIKEILP